VTAHAVVRQDLPAPCEAVFDLVHDYRRRLEWDTLLRSAETVDGVDPGPGVEAVCRARWGLGGLSFRTRYVTFRRPELSAVVLVNQPPVFRTWAASIRHRPLPGGRSEAVYTLTFTCRPACWPRAGAGRAGGVPLGDPPPAAGTRGPPLAGIAVEAVPASQSDGALAEPAGGTSAEPGPCPGRQPRVGT
jgi:hypothetical protein